MPKQLKGLLRGIMRVHISTVVGLTRRILLQILSKLLFFFQQEPNPKEFSRQNTNLFYPPWKALVKGRLGCRAISCLRSVIGAGTAVFVR